MISTCARGAAVVAVSASKSIGWITASPSFAACRRFRSLPSSLSGSACQSQTGRSDASPGNSQLNPLYIGSYWNEQSPRAMSCSPSQASTINGNININISRHLHRRKYSTSRRHQTRTFSTEPVEPILDAQSLQDAIAERASEMSEQLATRGYYTTTGDILPNDMITLLRSQSVTLRDNGRFEQSWSEKIVDGGSRAVRFDKDGVFACEPDGRDYHDAPDLVMYMSVLLQTLPGMLNGQGPTADVELSNTSFNAKLAVTSPGGSKYPLHIDNPQGLAAGDTRKLTCILYLNPEYQEGDGGELRMFLPPTPHSRGDGDGTGNDGGDELVVETVDLKPEGGRLLMFWSDEIPHEVLATAPDGDEDDASLDRYALTVWIPTTNVAKLHNESSKFCDLKDLAF